jgi:hypothetical protein
MFTQILLLLPSSFCETNTTMAKKKSLHEEMKLLTQYLISDSSENAKRPLLYPFFQKLYPEKFKIENDAKGADGYVEGVFILETKPITPIGWQGFTRRYITTGKADWFTSLFWLLPVNSWGFGA